MLYVIIILMKAVWNYIKKYYFIMIVIVAIIIKLVITINLPLNARDEIGADEYLMMSQAEELVSGNYLGQYNYLTLVKGIGFPLFLAISYKIGIPLLMLYALFYIVVCLVALIPVRHMVKSRPLQLLVFLLLLFCPATMDCNVQLIYRNMLIIPQSVLLVSALMMMYYHVNDKTKGKLLFWSILCAFAWIFMWHTREDSIWSVVPVIISWAVLIATVFRSREKNKGGYGDLWLRMGVVSLPIVFLFMSVQIISFVNYQNYGVYMTNQLNGSNYTKAVMTMMSVKPSKEVERVEITHDTLKELYKLSPTFATLKDTIEYDYDHKSGLVMAEEDNGEINEDLITWELTGAANAKGYYRDAQTAEKFWGDVNNEISQAIKEGKLETRFILPSRSLIPYPNKSDSLIKLMASIASLYIRGAEYSSSHMDVAVSRIDESITNRYEAISGGYAILDDNAFEPIKMKATRFVNYANNIKKIYSLVSPVLLMIGVIYYIGYTIFVIVRKVNKKNIYGLDRWLFMSLILGSLTVMLIGLGYVNAFMVDVDGYLASCNGLLNMFVALALVLIIQDVIKFSKYLNSHKVNIV